MTIDTLIAETFAEYYSHGSIEEIGKVLPTEVVEHFDKENCLYIPLKDYFFSNFASFYLIDHNNQERTYIANEIRETQSNKIGSMGLIDVNQSDMPVGYGEVDFGRFSFLEGKFFVGYTETFPEFQKQGLGTRRLYVMNALCQAFYQSPLNSGFGLGLGAERLWERLVEQGVAEVVKDRRYVFLD